MKQFELGHLYYYTDPHHPTTGSYVYFIRIMSIDAFNYHLNYYNIGTAVAGDAVASRIDLDDVFNHPKSLTRELDKNEKAKALLLGL